MRIWQIIALVDNALDGLAEGQRIVEPVFLAGPALDVHRLRQLDDLGAVAGVVVLALPIIRDVPIIQDTIAAGIQAAFPRHGAARNRDDSQQQ